MEDNEVMESILSYPGDSYIIECYVYTDNVIYMDINHNVYIAEYNDESKAEIERIKQEIILIEAGVEDIPALRTVSFAVNSQPNLKDATIYLKAALIVSPIGVFLYRCLDLCNVFLKKVKRS